MSLSDYRYGDMQERRPAQSQYAARQPQREQQDYESEQTQTQSQSQSQSQQQQQQQQQLYKKRRPNNQAAAAGGTNTAEGSETTLISVMKNLKTMWDIYQAFSSAWNVVAEHRQKQLLAAQKQHQEQQQQKQQQQQQQQQQLQKLKQRTRINSRRPPKFEITNNATNSHANNNNNNDNDNNTNSNNTASSNLTQKLHNAGMKNRKNAGRTTTTTSTTSTTNSPATAADTSAPTIGGTDLLPAKVEPRKAFKGELLTQETAVGLRAKRQSVKDAAKATATDVSASEGRYIKGDPLKGYYDFVITEGSYKFWAVFQVGTALLIIYSTFAAIYYSKVNPLVSDYDYTDYLGGARSLSGGDLDFVDDDGNANAAATTKTAAAQSKSWFEWLPRTKHSLKFILDAIDKLPVDHHASETSNQQQQQLPAEITKTTEMTETMPAEEAVEADYMAEDASK